MKICHYYVSQVYFSRILCLDTVNTYIRKHRVDLAVGVGVGIAWFTV